VAGGLLLGGTLQSVPSNRRISNVCPIPGDGSRGILSSRERR